MSKVTNLTEAASILDKFEQNGGRQLTLSQTDVFRLPNKLLIDPEFNNPSEHGLSKFGDWLNFISGRKTNALYVVWEKGKRTPRSFEVWSNPMPWAKKTSLPKLEVIQNAANGE